MVIPFPKPEITPPETKIKIGFFLTISKTSILSLGQEVLVTKIKINSPLDNVNYHLIPQNIARFDKIAL